MRLYKHCCIAFFVLGLSWSCNSVGATDDVDCKLQFQANPKYNEWLVSYAKEMTPYLLEYFPAVIVTLIQQYVESAIFSVKQERELNLGILNESLVAFLPDGKLIYADGVKSKSIIALSHLSSKTTLATLPPSYFIAHNAVGMTKKGLGALMMVESGASGGYMHVFLEKDGKLLDSRARFCRDGNPLHVFPDFTIAAYNYEDHQVSVNNSESGKCINFTFPRTHTPRLKQYFNIGSIALCQNKRFIALICDDINTLRIWDLETFDKDTILSSRDVPPRVPKITKEFYQGIPKEKRWKPNQVALFSTKGALSLALLEALEKGGKLLIYRNVDVVKPRFNNSTILHESQSSYKPLKSNMLNLGRLLQFSPCGRLLFEQGSAGKKLNIWDVDSGMLTGSIGSVDQINTCTVSHLNQIALLIRDIDSSFKDRIYLHGFEFGSENHSKKF